jgi:hypothetical protein
MTASFALRRLPFTLAALALGVALVVGGCAGASKPGSPRADAPQPATLPAGAALNRPDCPDNSNLLPGGLAPLERSIRGTMGPEVLAPAAVGCLDRGSSVECNCGDERCRRNLERLCNGFAKSTFKLEGRVATCLLDAPLAVLPQLFVGENPPTCQNPGSCQRGESSTCGPGLCCYVYQYSFYCCRISPYD